MAGTMPNMMPVMVALWSALLASALVLLVFAGARALSGRLGHPPWASPVLTGAIATALLLAATGIPLAWFSAATQPLRWLLGPALVALALVVEANAGLLRRSALPVLVAVTGGTLVGLASAIVMARWLGLGPDLAAAVSTKTVSTPFSVAIMMKVGGPVELAAAMSVTTGVVGALTVMPLLRRLGFRGAGPALALGVAAHIVGTDWLTRRDARAGGLAALAFVIAGVILGLLVPAIWPWLAA
ncbi:hypothetical protein IP88_04640 [alpha proteobacterium AAP81b]|nr:hypothetical protein IP88_04640 [alpha proteobacterium AAP81b]